MNLFLGQVIKTKLHFDSFFKTKQTPNGIVTSGMHLTIKKKPFSSPHT